MGDGAQWSMTCSGGEWLRREGEGSAGALGLAGYEMDFCKLEGRGVSRVLRVLTWISPLAYLPVVNSTCSDFNHGSALHIAASNLCLGAAKCLLEHGANPALRVLPRQHSTVIFLLLPTAPPHSFLGQQASAEDEGGPDCLHL